MPIKCAVEAFCRQGANLLTADAAFMFLLITLNKVENDLAGDMKNAIEIRIKKGVTIFQIY